MAGLTVPEILPDAVDGHRHPRHCRGLARGRPRRGARHRDRDLGLGPRPVGSHLIIDQEGNFLGSVSGGCVEGAVIAEAADVIEDGKPRVLEFGVADETAWRVGLSCGGRIRVLVEPVA